MNKLEVKSLKLKVKKEKVHNIVQVFQKLVTRHSLLVTFLVIALTLFLTVSAFADWTLPITISSGDVKTNLILGISGNGTDGYDQGLDSPTPFEGETLDAYFPHPDWNVIIAGSPVIKFHRDIRGDIPQDFYLEIKSTMTPVTIKWGKEGMPDKTTFLLYDHTSGTWTDMTKDTSYTFSPSSANPSGFTVSVQWGDLTPPSAPSGLTIEQKASSLFVAWNPNTEDDLAGYKIHFGTKSGEYDRTIDLKNVNNYTLKGLTTDKTYYITLSAYDSSGNESQNSTEVSGKVSEVDTTLPVFSLITADPQSALPSQTVKISFQVSKALKANPVVTVNGNSATYSSKQNNGYMYTYTVTKADPDGAATIVISGSNIAGNTGSGTCNTCLVLNTATFTVKGIVKTTKGKPVTNIKVTLLGSNGFKMDTTTNSLGEYSFSNIPRGKYVLKTYRKPGYKFRLVRVIVVNSDVVKNIVGNIR